MVLATMDDRPHVLQSLKIRLSTTWLNIKRFLYMKFIYGLHKIIELTAIIAPNFPGLVFAIMTQCFQCAL
jgi:hypothetical protein